MQSTSLLRTERQKKGDLKTERVMEIKPELFPCVISTECNSAENLVTTKLG